MATLLFTDIAGSSEIAVELGDERWRRLQARHHAEVRRQLKRHGGHEVDTAGDGFFATFSSPAAGVRCADAIVKAVGELGLEVRAGLHIGEAELTGEKVSGIAVTTAARVAAVAGAGQVLVTDTIVHLTAGSGLTFSDFGTRELKGVPGTWKLFGLAAIDGQQIGETLDPDDARQARDRSSPPLDRKRSRFPALPVGLGVLVVVAGGILLVRDRSGASATSPTAGSAPAAVVALDDESGEETFPVDLPALRVTGFLAGPIVFTGGADSPTAFAWVPIGIPTYDLGVAKLNKTSGAVVDDGIGLAFNTAYTSCVCVASAEGWLWTAIAEGNPSLNHQELGVSLRGIGIKGEPTRDIVVDKALLYGGVSALVSGAGYLWMGDSITDRVYRIDPRTSDVKRFGLQQSADVLVFADGNLWVLDTLEGKVTRLGSKGQAGPTLTLTGDLRNMAVGGGYVWVTDGSGNDVQRIPEDLGSAATPISVGEIGGQPKVVVYDDGAIVVGFEGGTIAKINPSDVSSPAVIWSHQVGYIVSSITVDRGIVWAAGPPNRNRF